MPKKKIVLDSISGPMLFKTDDGRLAWVGIFTNSFEDNDFPPEIIHSEAHKEFVRRANNGEVPMPELLVAHVNEWSLGKADFLTYDEIEPGIVFTVAVGRIDEGKEKAAEAIAGQECAMSHGMPYESMRRTIESYASAEVSITPKGLVSPANPLTLWGVLPGSKGKSEDINMIALREKLAALIGEENVASIEGSNKAMAERGKSDQVAYKDAPVADDADAEKSDAEPEVVAQADAAAETVEVEANEDAPVVEAADAGPDITELVATAMAEVLLPYKAEMDAALLDVATALAAVKESVDARLAEMEGEVKTVREQAGLVVQKNTIVSRYQELAASAAKSLDKDAPAEPEQAEVKVPQRTPSSFVNGLIAGQRGRA